MGVLSWIIDHFICGAVMFVLCFGLSLSTLSIIIPIMPDYPPLRLLPIASAIVLPITFEVVVKSLFGIAVLGIVGRVLREAYISDYGRISFFDHMLVGWGVVGAYVALSRWALGLLPVNVTIYHDIDPVLMGFISAFLLGHLLPSLNFSGPHIPEFHRRPVQQSPPLPSSPSPRHGWMKPINTGIVGPIPSSPKIRFSADELMEALESSVASKNEVYLPKIESRSDDLKTTFTKLTHHLKEEKKE